MSLSFYSSMMAIIWFTIFVAIGNFLRSRSGFLLHYSVYSLLSLIILSMVRLLVPIEFGFTRVIRANQPLTDLFGAIASPLPLPVPVKISVFEILLFVWISVAVYNIVRFLRRIWHDRQMLHAIAPEEDSRVAGCLAEIVAKSHSKKRYKLLVSGGVKVPMVIGLIRPTVLIPQSNLSDEQLNCLLAHEWQHVQNKDPWIKLIVGLVRCVMWWVPPVRTMEQNVEEVLESRCDLALTRNMGLTEKATYLKTLCLTYENAASCNEQDCFTYASRFVSVNSDKTVKERFEIVCKYKKGVKSSVVAFMLVVMLSFASSYLFVIQPYHEMPNDDQAEEVVYLTPENAYIQVTDNGDYQLFYKGEFYINLQSSSIQNAPFNQLPVIMK